MWRNFDPQLMTDGQFVGKYTPTLVKDRVLR